MKHLIFLKRIIYTLTLLFLYLIPCHATIKGIFLTQPTVESTKRVQYFIKQAKKHKINTFVIDIWGKSNIYKKNIQTILNNKIHVVSRIIVFPKGATSAQTKNQKLINKKLNLARYMLDMGVKEIQLDYIRYKPQQPKSYQNAKVIYKIIEKFKTLTKKYKAKLQIDIFGIVSYKPNHHIGQDVRLFANVVDVFCPMVYPSHFYPYQEHAKNPYKTIYNSLIALKAQLNRSPSYSNKEIIAYIELFNYRYPMNFKQRIHYIREQIKATQQAGITGWFAWSANNKYKTLFEALN